MPIGDRVIGRDGCERIRHRTRRIEISALISDLKDRGDEAIAAKTRFKFHLLTQHRAFIFDPLAWLAIALLLEWCDISLAWMLLIVPVWVGLRVWRLASQMRE